eukprot:m.95415 g.95415  ORF g.95415 m.95415 type:complete len:229 (+) comp14764_c2_seq2:127-813(+)
MQTAQAMAIEVKELRARGRISEAAAKLECTIQVLLQEAKQMSSEEARQRLLVSVKRYLDTLEELKTLASVASKRIKIESGATGHSFESIFGPVMHRATHVQLEEPYLGKPFQLHNLTRFCELCVRKQLTSIKIITKNTPSESPQLRDEALRVLRTSLRDAGVELSVSIVDDLHDRQARFNNGFIVRLGRGLHFYQKVAHYQLGSFDDHFRPCLATNIVYDFDIALCTQ